MNRLNNLLWVPELSCERVESRSTDGFHHMGKQKYLLTYVNTRFVSQEARRNPCCSPASGGGEICSSRACLFQREDLLSKSTFKFRRNELLGSLQSLSVVQCRVLGDLLGMDIYTENFHTVREQGEKNRIYPCKEKKFRTWSMIKFFLGDDQKPQCCWANC